MDRLESMAMIVAIAEAGSISAASRKTGMPVPTISRKLADLESYLNAQLILRSPRHVQLTEAGRAYIDSCKRIIEQVEDAERLASGEYVAPRGELTATAPWGLGHMHLLPLACEFMRAYPDIKLRLLLSDRVFNPLEERIDVAIRIGELPTSSMIATRIGSVRIVACASREYLQDRGTPKTVEELANHDCITVDDFAAQPLWKFKRRGKVISIPIRSKLTVNTSEAAVAAAIEGAGVARIMAYKVEAARRAGALSTILDEFEPPPLPMHIVYPERKPYPIKLRAFLDWMTPRLRDRMQ